MENPGPWCANVSKVTLKDFRMIKVLGRGSFGKVLLVEKKATKELFAMKVVRKVDILEKE